MRTSLGKLFNMFLVTVLCFAVTSCSLLDGIPAIPITDVIGAIQDAALILSNIDRTVDFFFQLNNTSQDIRDKYALIMGKTKEALAVVQRASVGVDSLTQEQYDKAIAEFKGSYKQLKELLASLGVLKNDGMYGARVGGIYVELTDPILLNMKARK